MAVVRIEPEPQVKRARCERCFGITSMLLGYVYLDETPGGIYYVDWCEGPHDERRAYVTVSLGNFVDEHATGEERLAFCIETRCTGMGLVNQPVHDSPEFLGRFLPRDEALSWEHIDELWHVCDHLTDDQRFDAVAAWLCGEADSAMGS